MLKLLREFINQTGFAVWPLSAFCPAERGRGGRGFFLWWKLGGGRSVLPALAGAAQLRATGNSRCWCIENFFNLQPSLKVCMAGLVITLLGPSRFSGGYLLWVAYTPTVRSRTTNLYITSRGTVDRQQHKINYKSNGQKMPSFLNRKTFTKSKLPFSHASIRIKLSRL